MIKDIALALEVGSSRDAARDYAISAATAFNAHVAAIGFTYEPMLPPIDSGSAVPFEMIDQCATRTSRPRPLPSHVSKKLHDFPLYLPSRA